MKVLSDVVGLLWPLADFCTATTVNEVASTRPQLVPCKLEFRVVGDVLDVEVVENIDRV